MAPTGLNGAAKSNYVTYEAQERERGAIIIIISPLPPFSFICSRRARIYEGGTNYERAAAADHFSP